MIKRLLGWILSMAVVALLVVTVLHRDRYRSMLPERVPEAAPAAVSSAELPVQEERRTPVPVPTQAVAPEPAPKSEPASDVVAETPAADSVTVSLPADSLQTALTVEVSTDPDDSVANTPSE